MSLIFLFGTLSLGAKKNSLVHFVLWLPLLFLPTPWNSLLNSFAADSVHMARTLGFLCDLRWQNSIILPVSEFNAAFIISHLADLAAGCSTTWWARHVLNSLLGLTLVVFKANLDLVRPDLFEFSSVRVALGWDRIWALVRVDIESECTRVILELVLHWVLLPLNFVLIWLPFTWLPFNFIGGGSFTAGTLGDEETRCQFLFVQHESFLQFR